MFKPQLLFVLMAFMAFQSCHADLLPLLGLGGDSSTSTHHPTTKAAEATATHHAKEAHSSKADSGILGLSIPLGGASSASNLLSALLPTASSSLNTAVPSGVSSGLSSSSISASSSFAMPSSSSVALPTSSIASTSLAPPPPPQSTPVVILTSTIPPPAATAASSANSILPTAGLLMAGLLALAANL
ncbi:hypothetical protein K450DRAFT_255057 [Umbelopsis ramanniana AG]|uniref:Uncharacterized protein n=1 Tax=Umbelopsis ramanniana AG TaxID=1314678 RepID=A0AAD5E4W1_UMBRA|nr:uncharacterized protein K450DRAFT_255057 [Umbelopsis ramanniana AG]KAI8576804.1 hypothetical protein K450DRAFT_255057 [Umbelopsis ramanniana AG]